MRPRVRNRLALFVKEPEAGRVKTRLAAGIGADRAARLYRAFLEDLAVSLPRASSWASEAAHDGIAPGPTLTSIFGGAWTFCPQGGGTLGERLVRSFERSVRLGAGHTLVAGSDVPTLTGAQVAQAFGTLETFQGAVFAPSPDGGFGMVGLSAAVPASFLLEGIAWSTGTALGDAETAARSHGIAVRLLPPLLDVDEAEDLATLREILRLDGEVALSTRAILTEVDSVPAGPAGAGP